MNHRQTLLVPLATAVASLSLMAWGTVSKLGRSGDLLYDQPKRFWEDVGLGIGCCLDGRFPVTYNPFVKIRDAEGRPHYVDPGGTLYGATEAVGIRPWEFWRTVSTQGFRRAAPPKPFPRFDDAGRPLLLCLVYRALGGVAPFAIFWLGLLVASPLVFWIALELGRAGRPVAGAASLVLVGLSPFVIESLSLPYAAIGFYLLGVLVLLALAVYANLGRPTRRGLLGRAALGSVAFAVCTTARGSGLLLLPGIILALVIAAVRADTGAGSFMEAGAAAPSRRRWPWMAAPALAILVLPYLVVSAAVKRETDRTLAAHGDPRSIPQHHPIWFNLWIGLGDFDRTKGYVWEDSVASAVLVRHGGTPISPSFLGPENEPILRDLMLADLRSDPLWYAGILVKRFLATVVQWKLRPWAPLDGMSMAPRGHPNEGLIDSYYGMTTTVDFLGVGSTSLELPLPILMLPAWGLVLLAWRKPGPARDRVRRSLGMLLCLAAGTLTLPLFITTAAGIETQAFALTYLVGIGLAVEELAMAWFGRRRVAAAALSTTQ